MPRVSQFLKPAQRSILFWIFITLSVPLAVGIIGYAAGYRINTNTKTVVETSALAIETTPKNAVVHLDGVEQEQHTPFITTVEPGTHTIHISKVDFFDWKKELTIYEGKAVIFPEILLFHRSVPTRRDTSLLPSTVSSSPLSQEDIAYYKEQGWQTASQLTAFDGPQYILVDPMTQESYVLSHLQQFSDQFKIQGIVRDVEWNNSDVAVILTDQDVWIFNKDLQQLSMLTRQSTPVLMVDISFLVTLMGYSHLSLMTETKDNHGNSLHYHPQLNYK